MPAETPDTPEGVALALLTLILTRDGEQSAARDYVLSLYRECYNVAIGYTPGPFKGGGDPAVH